MGLRVIAEGIEEESQFTALVEMGADEVQGFLFGVPCATPIIENTISSQERRTINNGTLQVSFGPA